MKGMNRNKNLPKTLILTPSLQVCLAKRNVQKQYFVGSYMFANHPNLLIRDTNITNQ